MLKTLFSKGCQQQQLEALALWLHRWVELTALTAHELWQCVYPDRTKESSYPLCPVTLCPPGYQDYDPDCHFH